MEIIYHTALAPRVLVVFVHSVDGWRAYIDAVPGVDHEAEKHAVAERGCKLREVEAIGIAPIWILSGKYGEYV